MKYTQKFSPNTCFHTYISTTSCWQPIHSSLSVPSTHTRNPCFSLSKEENKRRSNWHYRLRHLLILNIQTYGGKAYFSMKYNLKFHMVRNIICNKFYSFLYFKGHILSHITKTHTTKNQ